jgi:hypothetical protein
MRGRPSASSRWAKTSAAAASSASTAGCRPNSARARHRHAHLRSQHHGRRRRHGAGRPAPGGRDARHRLRAVRDGRDRQPGRQEPLHVRRPGPRAAGGAHADRHLVGIGGAAFAVAGSLVRAPAGPGGGARRHAAGQLRPAHRGAGLRRPGDLHGAQGAVGHRPARSTPSLVVPLGRATLLRRRRPHHRDLVARRRAALQALRPGRAEGCRPK